MESLKKKICTINQIEIIVLLYICAGCIFIFLGGLLVNTNPPNLQWGFPLLGIGFAFFVFAVSTDNAIKSEKRTNQILEKLNDIQEELKKKNELDPELKSDSENPGE